MLEGCKPVVWAHLAALCTSLPAYACDDLQACRIRLQQSRAINDMLNVVFLCRVLAQLHYMCMKWMASSCLDKEWGHAMSLTRARPALVL